MINYMMKDLWDPIKCHVHEYIVVHVATRDLLDMRARSLSLAAVQMCVKSTTIIILEKKKKKKKKILRLEMKPNINDKTHAY